MNRTILFSPVGGTDPISEYNLQEGALLHICRFYHPDNVYLYMSKEILDNHNNDNRYLYCLDKLAEQQNCKFEYQIYERKNLTIVQDFNYFYQDFSAVINEIVKTLDSSDRLLFNISSGTPAMKSALLVLGTLLFNGKKAELIQVSTPVKKMNNHTHSQKYDVELLWESNIDNEPDTPNRCSEVQCQNLELIIKETVIEQHLRAYNYSAALEVANTIGKDYTVKYLKYLEAASLRNKLDYKSSRNIFPKDKGFNIFPVTDDKLIKYFEYLQNLEIKCKRKEYADFIRAITPIILDLFVLIFEKETGIKLDQYWYDDHGVTKWELAKIDDTEIGTVLQNNYPSFSNAENNRNNTNFIKSDHIVLLIKNFVENHELIDLVSNLRETEKNIRNLAAHQIVSIDDEKIKQKTQNRSNKTGFSSDDLCRMLEKLFNLSCKSISSKDWQSYDNMNDFIIEKIKEKS